MKAFTFDLAVKPGLGTRRQLQDLVGLAQVAHLALGFS
jgi:hypothetical protein